MSSRPPMTGRGPRPRGAGTSGARGARGGSSSGASSGSGITIRGPPKPGATRTATPTSATNTPPPNQNFTNSTGIVGHKDKSGRITEYTSPEDQCPQCKTDRFLNPRLKLLVSPCYHKLCTSCIDRIWALGPAPCPECGNVCRKTQFGSQTFQDLKVEREVDVRKRIQRVFTKGQEDFPTLKEYNDYLEEIEQLTFNLIHGVDLAETNARIASHEAAKTRAGGTSTASSSATDIQSALDAHTSTSKKNRLDRYKSYVVLDRQLKTREEEAIVEALERGAEDEEIEAVQEDFKRQRDDVERSRNEQEERIMVAEEEERRVIAAGGKKSGGDKDAASTQSAHEPMRWESLQLFTGPLAVLSDGSQLLPSLGALRPPQPLETSLRLQAPMEAKSIAPIAPYDPWTSKAYSEMDNDARTRLNASGWDAAMPWVWQSTVAVQTLGVNVGGGGGPTS